MLNRIKYWVYKRIYERDTEKKNVFKQFLPTLAKMLVVILFVSLAVFNLYSHRQDVVVSDENVYAILLEWNTTMNTLLGMMILTIMFGMIYKEQRVRRRVVPQGFVGRGKVPA